MTRKDDVASLIRLLVYAGEEASRLGLPETRRLIGLPITALLQDYGGLAEGDNFHEQAAKLLRSLMAGGPDNHERAGSN